MAIGTRIREVRRSRRISQEDAARLAGIDRAYYGRIERGKVNVSAVNLLKIAEMLVTSFGRFFPTSRCIL
jgi:transcriptional regulator with XRE-family HTH domain